MTTALHQPSSAWRLDLARRLGASYAAQPKAAVVMAAGSTGRGTADHYSDLELDVYWHTPPTDDERRAAATGAGAELLELYPYEEDEWAEELSAGGFHVGTSTFLVATMERYLHQVLVEHVPDPLAQMRLYSVLNAQLLYGDEALVVAWRARAAAYPRELTVAVLRQNLVFDGLGYAEDMLAAREELHLLYEMISRVQRQVLGALLGLNRQYLPNPGYKGWAELIAGLRLVPPDLLRRFKAAYGAPPPEAVADTHAIINAVFDLVDAHVPEVDTRPYRAKAAQRRGVWDRPPDF
jgi:hypothetical protein